MYLNNCDIRFWFYTVFHGGDHFCVISLLFFFYLNWYQNGECTFTYVCMVCALQIKVWVRCARVKTAVLAMLSWLHKWTNYLFTSFITRFFSQFMINYYLSISIFMLICFLTVCAFVNITPFSCTYYTVHRTSRKVDNVIQFSLFFKKSYDFCHWIFWYYY